MSDQNSSFESVLVEDRVFPPPPDAGASLGGAWIDSMEVYRDLHAKSVADPEGFWAAAAEDLEWFSHWGTVLE